MAIRSLSLAMVLLFAAAAPAVTVKLTAYDLGLTNDPNTAINSGGWVDPDIEGKLTTSPAPGEGGVLIIGRDGKAGDGAGLLATVTARAVTTDRCGGADVAGGVLYLSGKKGGSPDAKNEGLGVRAFNVDGRTGERRYHKGLAQIEGSNAVSGSVNGWGRDDEIVTFTFAPETAPVRAAGAAFTFTQFSDGHDAFDLHVEFADGDSVDLAGLNGSTDALMSDRGGNVWDLDLDGLNAFLGADVVDDDDILQSVSITSTGATQGGDSHFLIFGFDAAVLAGPAAGPAVPEPLTLIAMTLAIGSLGGYIRRRTRA